MPNITLTPEQKNAVWHLISNIGKKQVQTMGGYAGTGKSVVGGVLAEKLPGWAVVAYTGKAADVARRNGVERAETIHSTIYDAERDEQTGKVRFTLKSYVGCDGFLIEEGSFVGKKELADLSSFGKPIIAIGDHGQLPPIGEDSGLMSNLDVRLETIHRNAGPIARFGEHLRKGGHPCGWAESGGAVTVLPRGARLTPKDAMEFDQVICGKNKDRVKVNARMIELLGRTQVPQEGHRVICLRNNRQFGVFNGQQGRIVKMLPDRGGFVFKPDYGDRTFVEAHPDGWMSERPPEYRQGDNRVPFDFSYCITGHKSQGDAWNSVFVMEQHVGSIEHHRWTYTVATRARTRLVWLPPGR